MKKFLFVFIAIIVGLGVGVYRIANIENSEIAFTNGSWTGCQSLPLGKDDLVTAQISTFALFALPSHEAIYLFARRDEQHEKLNGLNDYTITGNINQIKAKYWSITAYGNDLYLIPNEANRYSYNNSNLQTDSAGNFSITVSSKKQNGNWLPSPEGARFNLVLRIYKGESNFVEHLNEVPLPSIRRLTK